ncbi:hypothetical protein [Actinacidiphila acididurans]|uniref:Secreted protein n=1 Tax=Actinacidiphila acididurans TaxID=2784346 RepID=A0ABS2TZN6_9ACTN|nr:hypothetical protein [Actinacidiphila acididurans]MBM9508800.1 hypothetical protein [Actinacidiphila acididurans]
MKRRRTTTALLCTAALAVGGLAVTACDSAQRAWDCAKTAATIAGDLQDLQSTATNIGQVSDPGRRQATVDALDKVRTDLRSLGDRGHDSDVTQAVDRLDAAVRTARTTAAAGRTPDLRPVGSAASHLTSACTPG